MLCESLFQPHWHPIVCDLCVESKLWTMRDLNQLIDFEIAGVGIEGLRMSQQDLTQVLGFDPTAVSPTAGLD